MKTGIELIAIERQEQIEKHGRTIHYDIENNTDSQLQLGAEALLDNDFDKFPALWDDAICYKMLEKSLKERLIIAGALIAAEIDRLQATSTEIKSE